MNAFDNILERLKDRMQASSLYQRYRYGVGNSTGYWHSWDPHPWKYPWLSRENLERMKEYSRQVLEDEKKILEHCNPQDLDIAFCGNIANAMYVRAKPLRREGMNVSIYVHPSDHYVMSQPGWEEYDGVLPEGITDTSRLAEHGLTLPVIDDVHQPPMVEAKHWREVYKVAGKEFLQANDINDFAPYLSLINTLIELQHKDVLWCTQCVYMGFLAHRPYVASQMGGDLWLEASRGDMLGDLMRRSFGSARMLLASNPWSFAHARRFGYRQMIYLPKVLDEEDYRPGKGRSREEWVNTSGGDFYVLTTSRFDERNKGSSIGLEGFARFSKRHPSARLVFVGWGKDAVQLRQRLEELGVTGKVLQMPVSGKARLRDYLRSADIFIDQFVLGYFGSAGLEAMACGLPMIGRIETDQYDALCETGAPPVLNCSTAVQVADALERMASNSQQRMDTARDHREWFIKNHGSERWKEEYAAILAATAQRREMAFSGSPLSEPLGKDEIEYLKKGLQEAPPHLEYGW